MAEIVNLRRARKAKARDAKSAAADASRTKHGVARPVRELAKARKEKDTRAVDAHKLDKDQV
ncbi:MAG TPA: DUF4169 family protein [Rhizomicrobium sp.]|jgi:hypothetical protein|nr:DUF4169 family protein [Rhizomicrobium sp.]